jgi:hypothetical protein
MARSCYSREQANYQPRDRFNDYERYSRSPSADSHRSRGKSSSRSRESSTERRERKKDVRSPLERKYKTTANTSLHRGDTIFVPGKIEDASVNMFVDCGSGISLISDEIFRQITSKKLQACTTKLQAVNGQPLKVLGKARLSVSLGGTTRKEGNFNTVYKFYVAEGISHNVIIGLDFLQTYNAVIDLPAKKIIITDDYQTKTIHKLTSLPSDDFEVQVIAPEDIRIPARSQVTMSAKLSEDLPDGKIGHFKPKVDDKTPMAAHTVAVVQDDTINVRILNHQNEDVVIRCGMILGSLEDLDDENIYADNNDIDDSSEQQNENTRSSSHHQRRREARGHSPNRKKRGLFSRSSQLFYVTIRQRLHQNIRHW